MWKIDGGHGAKSAPLPTLRSCASARIQVRRDVARLGFGNSGRRHRGARRECLRRHDPFDEVVGRIDHHAADIDALPEVLQRPSDLAVAAWNARNGMTSGAAIASDDL